MDYKEITTDDIANAFINFSENLAICDKETAIGFRISKKKYILKSMEEQSFSKFTGEIIKRQTKKN